MKEIDLNVPEAAGKTQQNTFDRKNENTIFKEASISKTEEEIEDEPLHKLTYFGNYETR